MINIPDFEGEVSYKSYDELRSISKRFDTFEVFGVDESGDYELFSVSQGDPNNPCILILGSMHGSEWQGTDYSLQFMEQIRDNTYPDPELRNRLVNDFYLLFIVMQNPWGVDWVPNGEYGEYTSGSLAYRNSKGISFNSDYYTFSQSETQAVRDYTKKIKPFAVVDCHLFQPDYGVAYDRNAIVASGMQPDDEYQTITEPYVIEWKESMENKIGEEITRWTNTLSETSELARAYFARQPNDYTPYTLSYITEISRPAYRERDGEMELIRDLTDKEIFDYGLTHLYCFIKTSIKYFEDYKDYEGDNGGDYGEGEFVTRIEMDNKTVDITRNYEGTVTDLIETYDENNGNIKIQSSISRNLDGQVTEINRKLIGD